MGSRVRLAVAPAYLFACLILGGSAQGIWANMLLQLGGLAVVAWAAFERGDRPLARAARHLLILAIAFIALVALQSVPFGATTWERLGPRHSIGQGFALLGLRAPAEPMSLAPALALDSLLRIIPPLALFCAMVRLRAYRSQWLAVALIAGTLAGIALGALQVASAASPVTPWYLYADTNIGKGVGFFANADHMASLLVITIPFLAAIIAAGKTANLQRYSAIVTTCIGLGVAILVGVALNGSLAGYGLVLPVIAASTLIVLPPASRLRFWVVALAAVLVIGAVTAMEATAIGSGRIGAHAMSAAQSRTELAATTSRAAVDFMPFGSGLGLFRSVYTLYESPEQVTTTYVVHAHDDYLEVALELGVAGIVLMLLFLAWWAIAVWRVWRTPERGPFARAAAIASAAVLIHSLVDFPLRTAAIAACFGMCLALLADSRGAPPEERLALRRNRHVEFR
jgi:O-antigen ligase